MVRVSQTDQPRVVLVGRPGCHLCDVARPVVEQVCREAAVSWVERSIDDDQELASQFRDLIPVVLVDGVPVTQWHVDAQVLAAALAGGSGPAVRSMDA